MVPLDSPVLVLFTQSRTPDLLQDEVVVATAETTVTSQDDQHHLMAAKR
jgi:hypothetical protein